MKNTSLSIFNSKYEKDIIEIVSCVIPHTSCFGLIFL